MIRTKDKITSSVATIASCAAALLMFMPLGAKAQSASASDDGEVDRTPHIHGTLRSKYEYQTSEGEGRFEVRNARVSVDGKVTPFISYKAEIDLCDEGSIKMLDAYTRLKPIQPLAFTIGQMRVPFTIDAHRSPHQQYFANRSFIAKQVGNVRARRAPPRSVRVLSLSRKAHLFLQFFYRPLSVLPSGGADLHTNAADRTSADMLKFLFHISTALFRVEKFFSLHADSPHFTTNGTGRASFFTQIAVNTRRKVFVSLNFKRAIGEKSTETNPRTVFVVKKKAIFSYSSEPRKRSDFFVGIPSAIVPAALVDALRRSYRNIFIPVLFENKAALQKRAVDKCVHSSVVMKIRMSRLVRYLVNDSIGELDNNAHRIAFFSEGSVVNTGEADIGNSVFK